MVKRSDITRAFHEVRAEFPFPDYMDNNLNKYIIIISQLAKQHSPKSKVLSIGSGPCDLEAILSKLGYDITAVDDLKERWHLIGKNRERIKYFAKRMNIKLMSQPVQIIKGKENYFDAVLLIDIIEHLHRSPRDLLNYSISSLKTGGLLLIGTPNSVALAKRVKVLLGKTNYVSANLFYWSIGEYRSHVREYTKSELKQVLSYHNLTVVNSKMRNILTDMTDMTNQGAFFQKIIVKTYKLISGLYPNFRDTIVISGKKPKDWHPTNNSIKNFSEYYFYIEKWNLDNEPDELSINKMLRS